MPLNRRRIDRSERTWWLRTRILMLLSLAALVVIAFGLPLFATMSGMGNVEAVAGIPGRYMIAAQVVPVLFVVLVFWFVRAQERNDHSSGMAESGPLDADRAEEDRTWA